MNNMVDSMAACFDAYGAVRFQGYKALLPRVSMRTNEALAGWLSLHIEGKVGGPWTNELFPEAGEYWTFSATGDAARKFIAEVLPALVEKKEKAQAWLDCVTTQDKEAFVLQYQPKSNEAAALLQHREEHHDA